MLYRTFAKTGETMKSMGDKFLFESKTVTPRECLQYPLRQPASRTSRIRWTS